MTLPGVWSDVVFSPVHGFVVVISDLSGTRAVVVATGEVLWTAPIALLMLRAAVLEDGSVVALGQAADGITGAVLCRPAISLLGWPAYGQNCCLLTREVDGWAAGWLTATIQISGTEYVRQLVDGPRTIPQTIPIGPTSQGWLDDDPARGGLVWTDTNRTITVAGLGMVCAMQRAGCWVGQAWGRGTGIVGTYQGAAFEAIPDAVGGPLPHVATDGQGTFCIAAPLDGGRIAVTVCPPFLPIPPDPVVIPTVAPYPRHLVITPFDGRGITGPAVDAIGVFTSLEDPTALVEANPTRPILWCHDGPERPTVPAVLRRGFDQVWLECYRIASETLDESAVRWAANLDATIAQWRDRIVPIPMFYDQNQWTLQQTLDAAYAGCELARRTPFVTGLAPFAQFRANGMAKYVELQILYARVLAANPAAPIPPPRRRHATPISVLSRRP